jgi:hypothetical protein
MDISTGFAGSGTDLRLRLGTVGLRALSRVSSLSMMSYLFELPFLEVILETYFL